MPMSKSAESIMKELNPEIDFEEFDEKIVEYLRASVPEVAGQLQPAMEKFIDGIEYCLKTI